MVVVALTGGIATGKTTVARMFAEQGALVIDLDRLSRLVVEPHKPEWKEVVAAFGPTVVRQDGSLDRSRLARIIFRDPAKRKRLEQIVHPRVLEEYEKRLKEILDKGAEHVVIVDIPLLMEVGMQDDFEKVIVVYIPVESQLKRLIEREGLSEEEARAWLNSQISIEEKVALADFVIDNTGSIERTRRQVRRIYKTLRMLGREEGR
ncbi:MAG: dephospho-CoA kinase [Deltaproteobacteria bacterium]|nr:dephospho-CoA kinase [Deltaproteobacteria bacterium]